MPRIGQHALEILSKALERAVVTAVSKVLRNCTINVTVVVKSNTEEDDGKQPHQ